MRSAEKVAAETCLYAENFVYKVVESTNSLSADKKTAFIAGLTYYFGGAGNSTAEDVALQVFP